MKKVIFCILTVSNTTLLYVVTSENSEKKNVELAMEKDSTISERIVVETNREPRSFMKEMLNLTGNVLFGFDGGIYGYLATTENVPAFKKLTEELQQKPV